MTLRRSNGVEAVVVRPTPPQVQLAVETVETVDVILLLEVLEDLDVTHCTVFKPRDHRAREHVQAKVAEFLEPFGHILESHIKWLIEREGGQRVETLVLRHRDIRKEVVSLLPKTLCCVRRGVMDGREHRGGAHQHSSRRRGR